MNAITRTVTLPATALEVVVQEGDGSLDDLLSQGPPLFEVLPAYLAAHVTRLGDNAAVTAEDLHALPVPDYEYLAFQVYVTNIGDEIRVRDSCDKCAEETVIETAVSDLGYTGLPKGATPPDPVFAVELPRLGAPAAFGYLTAGQELGHFKALLGGYHDANAELYDILRSIGDKAKPELKIRDVRELKSRDRAVLRGAIDRAQCGYDPRVRWKCGAKNCRAVNVTNLLGTVRFFVPAV